MSIACMILGESGTGKSASLRHFDPAHTLLIQSIRKPLPFKGEQWAFRTKEHPTGNIFVTDQHHEIINLMCKTQRKIIVIDDFQYVMANEFMRRTEERGYDKFSEIGRHAWDIFSMALTLAHDKRVYILSHLETNEIGRSKIKTIGKMLDDKISLEGMVSICLKTVVREGQYSFSTRNNGSDTVKAPIGLFDSDLIDNDLYQVDQQITHYYDLNPTQRIA